MHAGSANRAKKTNEAEGRDGQEDDPGESGAFFGGWVYINFRCMASMWPEISG